MIRIDRAAWATPVGGEARGGAAVAGIQEGVKSVARADLSGLPKKPWRRSRQCLEKPRQSGAAHLTKDNSVLGTALEPPQGPSADGHQEWLLEELLSY